MKKDIINRTDIETLIDAFYEKAIKDQTIGYFFTDVIQISFEEHLPRIYAFWDSLIFGNAFYKGNPMLKHIQLNRKEPLTNIHFDRWLQLFSETIDSYFEGANAEKAKQKSKDIAGLMQYKIEKSSIIWKYF